MAAKPCPSGYYCPTSTAAPTPAPVGGYALGGQGAVSDWTTLQCDEGYTCTAEGAIGPYEAPCEAGTYAGAG